MTDSTENDDPTKADNSTAAAAGLSSSGRGGVAWVPSEHSERPDKDRIARQRNVSNANADKSNKRATTRAYSERSVTSRAFSERSIASHAVDRRHSERSAFSERSMASRAYSEHSMASRASHTSRASRVSRTSRALSERSMVSHAYSIPSAASRRAQSVTSQMIDEIKSLASAHSRGRPERDGSKASVGRVIDDEDAAYAPVHWINIIFLPFQTVFQIIILYCVFVKTTIGPLQVVYPIITCNQKKYRVLADTLYYFTISYKYLATPLYGIDTFLHIIHRQVVEEATKREHVSKSAGLLILDVISLIPMFNLVCRENCPVHKFWPNILAFNEIFIIYKVVEYFTLNVTHSLLKLLVGYAMLLVILTNCVTCVVLLMTYSGLCAACNPNIYDWRSTIQYLVNLDEGFTTYNFGVMYILTFILNKTVGEIRPHAIMEYMLTIVLFCMGYIFKVFVLIPKLYAECLLRMRRRRAFVRRVSRIVRETKRRNPDPRAYKHVEHFYSVSWTTRRGIIQLPQVFHTFPRYLRVEISYDLSWAIFYHSPTLRYTTLAYRHWLCEFVEIVYKLPGERFFTGPNCYTKIYYLKSGIIQIMSNDDSVSPIMSLRNGSLLGDVCFLVPPYNRQVSVQCLTGCEIHAIPRSALIRSLYYFPDDATYILNSVKERVRHARDLFRCKIPVRGQDRAEDEGISWVKHRWREISCAVLHWQSSKRGYSVEIPSDVKTYHCGKYVGQLVLCKENDLKTRSMFSKADFPWLVLPDSLIIRCWQRIRAVVLILVLLLYPPNVVRKKQPNWFLFFQKAVDIIYVMDTIIFFLTYPRQRKMKFKQIVMEKFRTTYFMIDILSLPWVHTFSYVIDIPKAWSQPLQLNRLIKMYKLFYDKNAKNVGWTLKNAIWNNWFFKLMLLQFSVIYVAGYIFYIVNRNLPEMNTSIFFAAYVCQASDVDCDQDSKGVMSIFFGWIYRLTLQTARRQRSFNYYIKAGEFICLYIFVMYMQSKAMAVMYLNEKQRVSYNTYVKNLKLYYNHLKIHPDLLKRLNSYLLCHWKYFNGMDVLKPYVLSGSEQYDVYWKLHGQVAERIIAQSKLLKGANADLIKDVAHSANFLILPQSSAIILFGLQCKNITWLVKGVLKCEYHDANGDLVRTFFSPTDVLSLSCVLYRNGSLKTFTADTDVEVLYLDINTFFKIVKRYPYDWKVLNDLTIEMQPMFQKIVLKNIRRYKNYQKKLRDKIFHARESVFSTAYSNAAEGSIRNWGFTVPHMGFLRFPESRFMTFWLTVRMLTFVFLVVAASLGVGMALPYLEITYLIVAACDAIGLFDICLKLFLPYYDKRGVVIRDPMKCMTHYVSRGFLMDILGCFPVMDITDIISATRPVDLKIWVFLHSIRGFCHLYLFTGYFDYMLNVPTSYYNYILILKWQTIFILMMLCSATYFTYECIVVKIYGGQLLSIVVDNSSSGCWLPRYHLDLQLILTERFYWICAKSMDLVQNGYHRSNLGMLTRFKSFGYIFCSICVILGCIYWYGTCYTRALLVLQYRGNTLFQHGVNKLKGFLTDERVEAEVIDKAVDHFTYCWKRSHGLDVHSLMGARMGVVFKQDLNYYFFKKTIEALDSVLHGGEAFQRSLSNILSPSFFMKQSDIMREMDLTPQVFIVHRGSVIITKDSVRQAIITKGGMFGQITDCAKRPIRVTATAETHCDLLELSASDFQNLLTDPVKKVISEDSTASHDYIIIKKLVLENPYNTIEYLLRGNKAIRLPWMAAPVDIYTCTWYSYWLYFVWLWVTAVTVIISLVLHLLPPHTKLNVIIILYFINVIYVINIILDFFNVELIVESRKCVYQYTRLKKFREIGFYCDIIALVVPICADAFYVHEFHLLSVLRLHNFYDLHQSFCNTFKATKTPMMLKFIIVIIILHAAACGWIFYGCKPYEKIDFPASPPSTCANLSEHIDWTSWTLPKNRRGGCAAYITLSNRNFTCTEYKMVVSKYWQVDYFIALAYILCVLTHTDLDIVPDLSIHQTCYKVFITIVLSVTEMWISSIAISTIHTKLRSMYNYDFNVRDLYSYLKYNGLTPSLLAGIIKYSKLLWQKQRGNWLPEMALEAPQCLRQDIFTSLYMHHLLTPTMFKDLPMFIRRQLAVRFRRIVIFPGKYIVEEGDIWPCMYFIHEGEVEKWYTDSNGDSRIVAVLSQNGFFGLIPGLFPRSPYNYTYYTRTVVDLVLLQNQDWVDLLAGYPDIREELMRTARSTKFTIGGHQ